MYNNLTTHLRSCSQALYIRGNKLTRPGKCSDMGWMFQKGYTSVLAQLPFSLPSSLPTRTYLSFIQTQYHVYTSTVGASEEAWEFAQD